MRCVLFSEQHLQKYFGGCDAESCMTCGKWQYTQDFLIRTLTKRKWHCCVVVYCLPGEDGREHLEVFHKCTLFLSCQIAGQVFPIEGIFPAFSLTFFKASLLVYGQLDHLVSTRTAGLSQWTLDSRKFLSWRRMAGVGIWGESSNQDRRWFIVCRNVYHPWVPKAQMMTEKNHKLSRIWKHSKSSVLVMKKITQEWSNLLNFSKTDHGC